MMQAAFATLAFLATLWLIGAIALQMAGESGGRIVAALRGRSPLSDAPKLALVSGRISQRPRIQRPMRALPQLRAAA